MSGNCSLLRKCSCWASWGLHTLSGILPTTQPWTLSVQCYFLSKTRTCTLYPYIHDSLFRVQCLAPQLSEIFVLFRVCAIINDILAENLGDQKSLYAFGLLSRIVDTPCLCVWYKNIDSCTLLIVAIVYKRIIFLDPVSLPCSEVEVTSKNFFKILIVE